MQTFEKTKKTKEIKCPNCNCQKFYDGPEGVGGQNILCSIGIGKEINLNYNNKLIFYGKENCSKFIDEWKAREEINLEFPPITEWKEVNYVKN